MGDGWPTHDVEPGPGCASERLFATRNRRDPLLQLRALFAWVCGQRARPRLGRRRRLILDDASTDGSRDVARALADGDARVAVIQHERNHGHIATYNEGLGQATGDYVVLLSADDMLTRGSLARAAAVMEARPRVGLVYGHPRVIHDEITPARTRGRGVRVWAGVDWISAQCRRGLSCIYSPEVCVRSSIQRAVGGYTPSLPHTGDLEMWLRIAAVADVARVNCDQAYRRGPTEKA